MNNKKIKEIFTKNKLEEAISIQKIDIGFTNKVYSVNEEYILKVCEDIKNEKNFEKEVYFYNLFKNKLPVPKILVYDKTKKHYPKNYIIYHKIKGENLYSRWHILTNAQRKKIIKQLCEILRIINKADYSVFVKKFKIDTKQTWHDSVMEKIKQHLSVISKKHIIPKNFIFKVEEFIDKNHEVLIEEHKALVYWDTHFDNIIVKGTRIVGILDFERTELSSIDFVLDIIQRMMDYPKKYMSEKFEKYGKKKDYEHLMSWFKEFYPELFKFEDMEKRLAMYAVEHDLDTLIWYPRVKQVKKMIAKTVGYKY